MSNSTIQNKSSSATKRFGNKLVSDSTITKRLRLSDPQNMGSYLGINRYVFDSMGQKYFTKFVCFFHRAKVATSLLPATTGRRFVDETMNINWNEAFTSSVLDIQCRRIDSPKKVASSKTDPLTNEFERFLEEKLQSWLKETGQLMKNGNGIDIKSVQ